MPAGISTAGFLRYHALLMFARLLLVMVVFSMIAHAQDSVLLSYLKQNFEGKPVVFREPQDKDDLRFSSTGEVLGIPMPAPLSLFGVMNVEKVEIKGRHVVMRGRRLVLFLDHSSPKVHSFVAEELAVTFRDSAGFSEQQLLPTLQRVFSTQDPITIMDKYASIFRAVAKPGAQSPTVVPGGSEQSGVYRVSKASGVSIPRPLRTPDPEYSNEARRKGLEGVSIWTVLIAPSGRIEAVRREKSLEASLDVNALKALRKWWFLPARKDGNPVNVLVGIEVKFNLN